MLVLKRKVDEAIWIGRDIRIIVAKIKGDGVSIGIEAPPNMAITREELIPPGEQPKGERP